MANSQSEQSKQSLQIGVTLPRLMTQDEFKDYVGKSRAWCERARLEGTGPRFVKLGRHVRYKAEDVLEWIDSNMRQSTSEQGGAA